MLNKVINHKIFFAIFRCHRQGSQFCEQLPLQLVHIAVLHCISQRRFLHRGKLLNHSLKYRRSSLLNTFSKRCPAAARRFHRPRQQNQCRMSFPYGINPSVSSPKESSANKNLSIFRENYEYPTFQYLPETTRLPKMISPYPTPSTDGCPPPTHCQSAGQCLYGSIAN